jgi:hypothetical protein
MLVAIAAAFAAGLYYFTRGSDSAIKTDASDASTAQEGMSGMDGMGGMSGTAGESKVEGMAGMSGQDGKADPDCTRYNLIEGVWVCTANSAGSGN